MSLIAFDVAGTLIYPDPSVPEIYAEFGRRHGISLEPEEIGPRFQRAFDSAQWPAAADDVQRQQWWQIVADVFECTPATCRTLFDSLWDYFSQPSAWAVYEDVFACWDQVRGARLSVAIASNFDQRIEPILRGHNLWVEGATFWSSRLRVAKPDRQFFRIISQELRVKPAECLMVGDDPVNDYAGPQQAGWNAVLIDRQRRCHDESIRRITSLAELMPLAAAVPVDPGPARPGDRQ